MSDHIWVVLTRFMKVAMAEVPFDVRSFSQVNLTAIDPNW